jgi:hypothetical protein
MKKTFNLLVLCLILFIANAALAVELPKDFVNLKEIEPRNSLDRNLQIECHFGLLE